MQQKSQTSWGCMLCVSVAGRGRIHHPIALPARDSACFVSAAGPPSHAGAFLLLSIALCRYIQSTCATSGEGLYEGLDWLSSNIASKKWAKPPSSPLCCSYYALLLRLRRQLRLLELHCQLSETSSLLWLYSVFNDAEWSCANAANWWSLVGQLSSAFGSNVGLWGSCCKLCHVELHSWQHFKVFP